VHHSGTKNGNLKIFDYYHRHKGMVNGVAYHFVIGNGTDSGDGEIEVTNRWKQQLQGGHLASEQQNQIALGICLVGDFDRTRPTRKQIAALVELIEYLSQKTGPRPRVMVHREINVKPTDCPGRYFPAAALHRLFDGRN
jgi:N-acetyl-anhydromuramyl-L-alanine amidase AmpD